MSLLDQLGGESIPSFFTKESPVGASVTGTIVKADIVQMRKFGTNDLEFWDDGNPKNQVRVVLDPGNGEHVGVYVKTWGVSSQNLKDAVLAAGMTDLDRGATCTATFTHEIPSDTKGYSPTKVYDFAFKPASATAGMFADTTTGEVTQQQTATSVPVDVPAQPAAPAPAESPNVVDEIKRLHALGLDATAIKGVLGNNPAVNDQVIAAVIATAA